MKYSALLPSCAAALLVFATGCSKETKVHKERTTRVEISTLQKHTFREQIPVQGTVMPVEYATISAKISGTLEDLKVDEGDICNAGDVLFGIDHQVLKNQVVVKKDEIKVKEAALQSANFALKAAEISCRQAQSDYDRALTLKHSKAISLANFESAETTLAKAKTNVQSAQAAIINARSQLKQAQSNLEIAEKNLEDSVIKAPFDCVIVDKFAEEKEFVTAGQNILKLENHQQLEVICHISAVYYNQITAGKNRVEILTQDGKTAGFAPVTYKSPAIDPDSRTFKLKVLVPREIKLVSGMLCDLKVILQEKEAYGLPADAVLLRANDVRIAYTVNAQNRAESVEIKCGITADGYSEILNHADYAGKKFVISGQTFLNNGALLSVISNEETK
jgi:multidrug efflux pump subunit AcrA (membrane-fusion protein)